MDSNFIITCPLCGFSFKKLKNISKKLTCPKCKYIFKDTDDLTSKFDDFMI